MYSKTDKLYDNSRSPALHETIQIIRRLIENKSSLLTRVLSNTNPDGRHEYKSVGNKQL
jgi:hypothetical protein